MCLHKTKYYKNNAFQPLLGLWELKKAYNLCNLHLGMFKVPFFRLWGFWDFPPILVEFLCISRKSVGYSINCSNSA
jgi:hypothetical protein